MKTRFISAFVFSLLFISFLTSAFAQDGKSYYWNTILNFKKQDSTQSLPSRAILFVGSSSFTNWNNVQQMFPEYLIVNRGFGGSQLPDLKLYFETVKYPPKLKQIVIYAGDNDIASGANASQVLERFKALVQVIRNDKPKVPILYLSIKGCPGRANAIPTVKEANQLLKEFISKQARMEYADIFSATMDLQGKPMNDIYIEDGVHLNQKGYSIWASVLKPHLKK